MKNTIDAYLNAIHWVKTAGDNLRAEMQKPLNVHTKTNHRDLVTQFDIATERYLTEQLRATYPDHRIFGEESQSAGEGEKFTNLDGLVWILDPIDGTINFVKQHRDFGIMLALYQDGKPLIGVVYDVMRDELYSSLAGHGAYCNGKRLEKLPEVTLRDSLVIIEGSLTKVEDPLTLFVLNEALSCRMVGSSAIVTTILAHAGAGAFISKKQMPWDAAAPMAILTELGAIFTHPDGSPLTLLQAEPVIMALPNIHQELITKYNELND